MHTATRHASLQNADAVLDHIQDAITGLYVPWTRFRAPAAARTQLGVELDDVYWHDEPIVIRVQADAETTLRATLNDLATRREAGSVSLAATEGAWARAELPPVPSGTYRLTVAGGARVEPVTDVFTVFERGAGG